MKVVVCELWYFVLCLYDQTVAVIITVLSVYTRVPLFLVSVTVENASLAVTVHCVR